MKEDKNKLKPMLRAFKAGHITLEFAVDFILRIYSVSKRFIIEVFLNDRRLEYRASNNETDIDKELIELKRTYKSNNCVFYKGELNVC